MLSTVIDSIAPSFRVGMMILKAGAGIRAGAGLRRRLAAGIAQQRLCQRDEPRRVLHRVTHLRGEWWDVGDDELLKARYADRLELRRDALQLFEPQDREVLRRE